MAYRNNLSTQISMDDSFERLTERQKKVVLKSWAKDFADYVFPSINSDAFRVLYSNNNASRPSVPANYIIGAMIIKELLGLTDDETVDMIQVDVRAQYALHSTSLEEQPISDRTFSRFRERLYNYEMETGIDLLKEEMNHLSDVFCRYLNINRRVKRMDSLMVAMHAKSMGRLEILYTTVEKCIKLLAKENVVTPDEMKHYLDNDDLNEVICKRQIENGFNRYSSEGILHLKEVQYMKQSTYEHWKTIIDDQQKSGLGVKAYCKEHGISDKSFYDARRRVGAKESGVKIVPVKLETRRNTTIMINGVPVCIQDDTDTKALATVVKACMSL